MAFLCCTSLLWVCKFSYHSYIVSVTAIPDSSIFPASHYDIINGGQSRSAVKDWDKSYKTAKEPRRITDCNI